MGNGVVLINLKFVPVHFTFSYVTGIFLGFYFELDLNLLMLVLFILWIMLTAVHLKLLHAFHPPFLFAFFSFLIFVFLGSINVTRSKPANDQNHYTRKYHKGSTVEIQLLETLRPGKHYLRYLGKVIRVNGQSSSGKIMLRITKEHLERPLTLRDLVITSVALKKIRPAMNPGAFDFKAYAQKKGVHHQLDLKTNAFLIQRGSLQGARIMASALREKIIRSLARLKFSEDHFAVITALLLGKRQELSTAVLDEYRDAGALHILAISGLHIGILLLLLELLFKPFDFLKKGKQIKMVFLLCCLWCFALISGLSASVVRAVCMFTAVTFGVFLDRSPYPGNALFLSLLVLLFTEPLYLFDAGFQLSYSAVFSILALGPLLKGLWNPKHRILSYFWNLFCISLAAQIGVLPLGLFYFHQFSGSFVISSLVIIPFLGTILGLGFLIIILDQAGLLPDFLIFLYDFLIGSMNNFVGLLSEQRTLIFDQVYFSFFLVSTAYAMIYFGSRWLKYRKEFSLKAFLCCVFIMQCSLLHQKFRTQRTRELVVFEQVRHTVITKMNGKSLEVYSDRETPEPVIKRVTEPYKQQYYQLERVSRHPLKNFLTMNNLRIFILDNEALTDNPGMHPDILILRNSPKINLDRLLTKFQPKILICDGSNFRSFARRWKRSCAKAGIKFHDTYEKGAFVYKSVM